MRCGPTSEAAIDGFLTALPAPAVLLAARGAMSVSTSGQALGSVGNDPSSRAVAGSPGAAPDDVTRGTSPETEASSGSVSRRPGGAAAETGVGNTTMLIDERHMWLIKIVTQLFGVHDGDFNARVEQYLTHGRSLELINHFLSPHSPRGLFVLLSLGFPEEVRLVLEPAELRDWPVKRVIFFVRTNAEDAAVSANVGQDVFYGQLGPHAIKSFSLLLKQVYNQLLPHTPFPSDLSADDEMGFLSNVSKFSDTMADVVQVIDCGVHFKKVHRGVLHRCRRMNSNALEPADARYLEVEIAEQWISAVERELEADDSTLNSLEDLGPDAPLAHWRQRLSVLTFLTEHFENTETREVVHFWKTILPEAAQSWVKLEDRLRACVLEASETVTHLGNLHQGFHVLYADCAPQKIGKEILTIFSKVKMMRYMCTYLQKDECVTGLLVKIVNQIVTQCKRFIRTEHADTTDSSSKKNDPGSGVANDPATWTGSNIEGRDGTTQDDVWRQKCDTLLDKMEECIKLSHACQATYREVKNEKRIATAWKDLSFSFDESHIFAKLVHFEKRLEKLREMFNAYHFFQKLSLQNDGNLQQICKTFFKVAEIVKGRPYDVLDITAAAFDVDFDNIRIVILGLEQQLQDYIDKRFKHTESTEQSLDMLANFQALLDRDSLKPYLNAKHVDVFTNFMHDLDVVSNLYETQKENPPITRDSPPVAGRIMWVRHLLQMIEVPMKRFQQNKALMISKDCRVIIKKYNQIAQAFVSYEVLWEHAWHKTVQTARKNMNAPVLVIHPENGKLYVNLDNSLLQVMREAKCMRPLGAASGLKWKRIGLTRPNEGREITNLRLANELRRKTDFEQEEWNNFSIPDLDKDDFILCGDAYFKPAGIDIPDFVVDMINREAKLKTCASRLRFFIEEYNSMRALIVPDLEQLFDFVLASLDHSIRGGLSSVLWSSIHLDDYIEEIFQVLSKTRDVIKKAHDLYENRVMKNLSLMCQMKLVRIPKSLVTTSDFVNAQKASIEAGTIILNSKSIEIENAIVDIVGLVQKSHPEARQAEAIRRVGQGFMTSAWQKVYSAVLSCFRKSFDQLKNRIKTAGTSGLLTLDNPFFKVEIELLPPQIKASPSIDDVQLAVNRTALSILQAMKIKPWQSMTPDMPDELFDISERVLGSIDVVRGVLMLTGSIASTSKKVEDHMEQFNKFDFLWKLEKRQQLDSFLKSNPTLDDFISRLSKYQEIEKEILRIPNIVNVGPLCLSNERIKFSLSVQLDGWRNAYTRELMKDAAQQIETTNAFFSDMKSQLDSKVRDLDEVRTVSACLEHIRLLETDVEQTFNRVETFCQVAKEFYHPMSNEEEKMVELARNSWASLQSAANRSSDRLFRTQENFRKDLMHALDGFSREVKDFQRDFKKNGPVSEQLKPHEGVSCLTKYQKLYEEKAKKLVAYRQGEKLFGLTPMPFDGLTSIKTSIALLSNLYTLYTKYKKSADDYMKITFPNLRARLAKMRTELKTYAEKLDKLDKALLLYPACIEIREGLHALHEILPIIENLVKTSMRARHWSEIMASTQTVLDYSSPQFTLKDLADASLQKHGPQIQQICATSEEEAIVEEKLESVARQWRASSLTFKDFKSFGPVLLDVLPLQHLMESMEETKVALHNLSHSRYGLPFKESIDENLHNFSMFMDLIELWRSVQHVWWYVSVVFSSEDVSKQLPQEAQRFHNVNQVYVKLMLEAFNLRYVAILHDQGEEIRRTLTLVMEDLELCEKQLAGYLGTKRDSFPRLYYISDKVLLEALSQTSGLDSIQNVGVLSLFGNVKRLVLRRGNPSAHRQTIESVQSDEAEVLEFREPVEEASVEILLSEIERQMRVSLQELTRDAITDLVPNLAPFDVSSLSVQYPCQACILAIQCWFTEMCESTFTATDGVLDWTEVSARLSYVSDQFIANLRTYSSSTSRAKFEALFTLNIMHENVVRNLITDATKDRRSWIWQRQLKFNTDEKQNVQLSTLMYKSPHTYEFIGCRKRLIHTAQTNKCYLFLLNAVASQQCASLAGVSGCGKSETIHELGRMLGRYVLQFRCSAEVGYASINSIMSGLNKTGSWVSFDDLSHLPAGMLSVMAQQLVTILDHVRTGSGIRARTFNHNEAAEPQSGLSFSAHCPGIFCSSNAAVDSERSLLPDNLRSHVRVLSVMEPDLQVVLFVKLCFSSISRAEQVAQKIDFAYRTLTMILPDSRSHNFDLRNAIAVVNHFIEKCRNNNMPPEEELRYAGEAINDLNAPQMDERNMPVLHLVLGDVFGFKPTMMTVQKKRPLHSLRSAQMVGKLDDEMDPNNTFIQSYMLPLMDASSDPKSLNDRVSRILNEAHLNVPIILQKCIQAYQLSTVRNGILFLGQSFCGKSLCCRTLVKAISEGEDDQAFKVVFINPVALGPRHLYGWYDSSSNEWTDGTFSAIWRKASRTDTLGTWLVLDGPMNSSWVEYLYTALEDVQILSLANGERMMTKSGNKLIFEVDELHSASPSAISRMGIVHFRPDAVNYRALLWSWLRARRSTEIAILESTFYKLLEPILEILQNGKDFSRIPSNVQAQTRQFLHVLEALLEDSVVAEEIPHEDVMERFVLVSIAWAFTGSLTYKDRKKVDYVLRNLTTNLPDEHKSRTLIDNVLRTSEDEVHSWTAAAKLCDWTYSDVSSRGGYVAGSIPKMIVSSPHAVSLWYLTQSIVEPSIGILVAGARGVGKSTICTELLDRNRSKTMLTSRVILSVQTSNHQFQNMIERNLSKRQGNRYGPLPGKSLLILVEDLNIPQKDNWGDEPCAELMRFLLETQSLASLQKPGEFKILNDTKYVASATCTQNGFDVLPERLRTRCLVFMIPEPDFDSQFGLFEQIILGRNRQFPAVAYETKDAFVNACAGAIKLVMALQHELMPCRRFCHWSFNMHNVARICQSLLAQPPDAPSIASNKLFASFFYHECERELCDQLPEDKRKTFHTMMEEICNAELKVDMRALRQAKPAYEKVIWTDADFEDSRDQDQGQGKVKLKPLQNEAMFMVCAKRFLSEHNEMVSNSKADGLRMDQLVLFPDMIAHLLRLVRVLRMERGHAILLGAPRSGKRSVVRLAAFVVKSSTIPISSSEAKNVKVVKDVIRQGFTRAAMSEQVIIAVSVDTGVPPMSLDTIFWAIRNADIQPLVSKDDFDQILNGAEFQKHAFETVDRSDTIDLREVFRERVMKNLHFVLTFAMTLQECSELPIDLPGECSIDLWLPYEREVFEEIALQYCERLCICIDEHSENVVYPDVREAMKGEMKESLDWDADDLIVSEQNESKAELDTGVLNELELSVQAAMQIQHELCDGIKQRIRLILPRQMAESHVELIKINNNFCRKWRHKSYLSESSFRSFCKGFQKIFMNKFEKLYEGRKRLRIAIKTVSQCETDLAKAKKDHEDQKGVSGKNEGDFRESILATIKTRTASLQQANGELSELESDLIFTKDKIEDMQEEFENAKLVRDTENAKVTHILQQLEPERVNEITRLTPLPVSIGQVFDIVLILLRGKLNQIQVVEINKQATVKDSWMHGLVLAKYPGEFCQSLLDLDLDTITPEQLELVQPYLTSDVLSLEKMQQIAKGVAVPLVRWLHSVMDYCATVRSSLLVMRTVTELTKARTRLGGQVEQMQNAVHARQEELTLLRKQYDDNVTRLQAEADRMEKRDTAIRMAEDLIVGLRVQQDRWSTAYSEYVTEVSKVAGDSSVASAFITYCGLLDSTYRSKVEHEVLAHICTEASVLLNMPINNMHFLSSESERADWQRQGLPADNSCFDSACIVKHVGSWPLIIDPYGHASVWIRNHHKADGFRFVHANDVKFIQVLQTCVSFGKALFVDGVDADLEHDLGDLWLEDFRGSSPRHAIKVGGETIECNSAFQIYFSTRNKIPQSYSANFAARVSVINFGALPTFDTQLDGLKVNALEQQLAVAILELADENKAAVCKDLYQRDIDLQAQIQANQERLIAALCEIQGNVVDSVSSLNEIKDLRNDVGELAKRKQGCAKDRDKMSQDIDHYLKAGIQCGRLLEIVLSMSVLNEMYVVSIKTFMKAMERSWKKIEQTTVFSNSNESEKTEHFIQEFRAEIYSIVSASLLPGHKLLWQLLLSLEKICKQDMKVNVRLLLSDEESKFVTTDQPELNDSEDDSEQAIAGRADAIDFDRIERSLLELSWFPPALIHGFFHLQKHFDIFGKDRLLIMLKNESQDWTDFLSCQTPEKDGMVPYFDARKPKGFTPFHRLVLLRMLRPDRFSAAVHELVHNHLEVRLRNPVGMSIHDAYLQSDSQTPIVIINCQNIHTVSVIENVAKSKFIKCLSIALGNEEQRHIASKMLLSGPGLGMWLVLENSQLDLTFLNSIPSIMEKMEFSDQHFRLYITAEADMKFPTSLLQISLRQYAEPALGLKSKFVSSLSRINHDAIESIASSEWIVLLYAMSFLHSWILARGEWAQHGWCLPHEFHSNDLLQGFRFMKAVFEDPQNMLPGMSKPDIPWETVQKMCSDILFGSAIEHSNDKAVLESQINYYLSSRIFGYDFHYVKDIPGLSGNDVHAHIRILLTRSIDETAEVFGLQSSVGVETEHAKSSALLLSLGTIFSETPSPEPDLADKELKTLDIATGLLEDTLLGCKRLPASTATGQVGTGQSSGTRDMSLIELFAMSEEHRLGAALDQIHYDLRMLTANLRHGLRLRDEHRVLANFLLSGQTPWRWMVLSFEIASLPAWLQHMRDAQMQVGALGDSFACSVSLGLCCNPAALLGHYLQHICRIKSLPHESVQLVLKIGGAAERNSAEAIHEEALVLTGLWLSGASWDDGALTHDTATPRIALKPQLVALPHTSLRVETARKPHTAQDAQSPSDATEMGTVNVPVFTSEKSRRAQPLLHAQFVTDLPKQTLALSSCAVFCINTSQ